MKLNAAGCKGHAASLSWFRERTGPGKEGESIDWADGEAVQLLG